MIYNIPYNTICIAVLELNIGTVLGERHTTGGLFQKLKEYRRTADFQYTNGLDNGVYAIMASDTSCWKHQPIGGTFVRRSEGSETNYQPRHTNGVK